MAIELSVGNALAAGAWLLAATTLWYLYRAYVVRSRFQRLQRQGVVRLSPTVSCVLPCKMSY